MDPGSGPFVFWFVSQTDNGKDWLGFYSCKFWYLRNLNFYKKKHRGWIFKKMDTNWECSRIIWGEKSSKSNSINHQGRLVNAWTDYTEEVPRHSDDEQCSASVEFPGQCCSPPKSGSLHALALILDPRPQDAVHWDHWPQFCHSAAKSSGYLKNDRRNSGGTLRQKFNLHDI